MQRDGEAVRDVQIKQQASGECVIRLCARVREKSRRTPQVTTAWEVALAAEAPQHEWVW